MLCIEYHRLKIRKLNVNSYKLKTGGTMKEGWLNTFQINININVFGTHI